MKTKKSRGAPKKRFRVTLIYPPANFKNSEPFPLPNMSIAVLARTLKEEGHEAVQSDLEKLWFSGGLKAKLSEEQHALLDDYSGVEAYVNGRAPAKAAAAYRRLSSLLLRECGLRKSDLFGFSLIDMRAEPLILNFSLLLAFALKQKYGAAIAMGSKRVPRDVFAYMMKKYPCIDYGVYAEWGERALSAVMLDLAGKKAAFTDTVVRARSGLKDHYSGLVMRPRAPIALYDQKILDAYKVTDSQILSRYNSGYPLFKQLLKKERERLVVLYSFEHTCPGTCAFCPNDNKLPSDAKPVSQILDELAALKEMGVTGIYFINSAFNNSYSRAEAICDGMIKGRLGLHWVDCANLRVMDEPLLDKMRAAGAVKLTFGMETASPRLLRYMHKGTTIDKVRRLLEYSDKIGIWNHMELIGGLPTETPEDVRATVRFVEESRDIVNAYSLNPFYLYHNSPFFWEKEKFGLKIRPTESRLPEHYFSRPGEKVGEYSEKFDEIGGLKWEEKNLQISESAKTVADAIGRVHSYKVLEWEHVQLLMCLYDKLGHAKKPLIRKMMEILTARFMPYNLDFFFHNFLFKKHRVRRELEPPGLA